MIGQEHFGSYLRKKIFLKYGISARIQQIIRTFFKDQIQEKVMTKFPIDPKTPFLAHLSHFWGKN